MLTQRNPRKGRFRNAVSSRFDSGKKSFGFSLRLLRIFTATHSPGANKSAMTTPSSTASPMVARRLLVVAGFAVAMAWVESAVVFYLRRLVDRIEPYQPNPLPIAGDLGGAELVREAATLVMLVTVGWLAGRSWRSRFGYFVAAFGVWDIFYYVFLIPLTGWPHSLLDWDILFLIPLPWWGPVLAPVMIAVLMVVGGAVLAFNDERDGPPLWPSRRSLGLSGLGVSLALAVFMADAIGAVRRGESIQLVLPVAFNWPLFLVAWTLMAVPAVGLVRGHFARRQASRGARAL